MRKLFFTVLLVLLCVPAFSQGTPSATDDQAAALPLHLGIVLRASKTTFPWQQAAATELVRQLIHNPGDEAFVISAGGDRPWPYERLDWDNKPESLAKFIKGLDKNAGMPEPFKFEIQGTSTAGSREYTTKYEGAPPETSVFAIVAAMMKSDSKPARRAVILFRDPWDHCPGWGSAYSQFVDQRHDAVVSILKTSGAQVYVIGIEDVATRPQITSDIGSSYAQAQSGGSGGMLRRFDQDFRKQVDFLMAAGRNNMERFSKETGGEVAYGTKKNYADVVPVLVGKIDRPNTTTTVGK